MNPSQMMPSQSAHSLHQKKRRSSEQVIKDVAVGKAKKMKRDDDVEKRELLVDLVKTKIKLCKISIRAATKSICQWQKIREQRVSRDKQLIHRLKIEEERLDLARKQECAANQVLGIQQPAPAAHRQSSDNSDNSDNSESGESGESGESS